MESDQSMKIIFLVHLEQQQKLIIVLYLIVHDEKVLCCYYWLFFVFHWPDSFNRKFSQEKLQSLTRCGLTTNAAHEESEESENRESRGGACQINVVASTANLTLCKRRWCTTRIESSARIFSSIWILKFIKKWLSSSYFFVRAVSNWSRSARIVYLLFILCVSR